MRWLNNMEVSNLIMASHLSTNMYPNLFIIIIEKSNLSATRW